MNNENKTAVGIKKQSSRILALDILRGITIAGMVLVNNPGSWGKMYAPMQHAQWNGLTPTDLVFPFFMFIMGISTFIALRKFNFEATAPTVKKILKRTLLLYLVGLGVAWLSLTMRTFNALSLAEEQLPFFMKLGQSMWNFDRIRFLGVIPRLAITYGATSLIAITINHKYLPHLIASILIGYFILLLVGNGFAYDTTNILSRVDMRVLGPNHMYSDNGIDPEGVLSTIPSIAHVLLGFYIGKIMMETENIHQKIERLFIIGTILTLSGFMLSYGCPINKKVWSPTFVIVTIGLASLLLALLIWVVDIKGHKKWSLFFVTYGVNPLFMYILGAIIAIVSANIILQVGGENIALKTWVYGHLRTAFGDYFGSFLHALMVMVITWIPGYYLYKKKIYIKL